jgi:RNA polymerase sigma factor (sigma-70 family)
MLDTPIFEDSDEYITRADTITDEATFLSDASYRIVDEEWMSDERRRCLLMALELLPSREREVLQLLYGLGVRPAMNMQEVAMLLGVSTKRVGQIRKKALQHALRAMPQGG